MSHWNNSELEAINDADDLKIAPFHEDLQTTGTPTWIWEVVVENNLYVRAYSGVASRWYQSAIKQKRGKIIAAGKTIDVTFDMVDDPHLLEEIDKAYQQNIAVAHMCRQWLVYAPRLQPLELIRFDNHT